MLAIKKARKLIEKDPQSQTSRTLAELIIALETEQDCSLKSLYQLKLDDFDLAMDMLREWRLDRYYLSKVRLMDASLWAGQWAQPERAEAAPEMPAQAPPPVAIEQ